MAAGPTSAVPSADSVTSVPSSRRTRAMACQPSSAGLQAEVLVVFPAAVGVPAWQVLFRREPAPRGAGHLGVQRAELGQARGGRGGRGSACIRGTRSRAWAAFASVSKSRRMMAGGQVRFTDHLGAASGPAHRRRGTAAAGTRHRGPRTRPRSPGPRRGSGRRGRQSGRSCRAVRGTSASPAVMPFAGG